MRGLSPVAASGGHSSSQCAGLSLSRPLLLLSTGSRRAGSVVVAHGPSCSAACGIFPDQGSNLCALHWPADSQPLRHQGSPKLQSFKHENPALAKPFCLYTKPRTLNGQSIMCDLSDFQGCLCLCDLNHRLKPTSISRQSHSIK